MRGAPVTTQVHAALSHALPGSPSAAFTQVSGDARNLETRLAGAGLVGDNLGTALDKARQDALYAQLLFLFLGVPGAVLAGLVTASIASAGADRRRRDSALLRTRGASTGSSCASRWPRPPWRAGSASPPASPRRSRSAPPRSAPRASARARSRRSLWAGGAALAGLAIAAAAIALPAWRDARSLTVAGQRRQVGRRDRPPWWARYGLDFVALAGAGARLLAGLAQRLPARAGARGRAAGLGQLVRAARAGARLDRRRPARPTGSRTWLLARGRTAARRARCARSPASCRRPSRPR